VRGSAIRQEVAMKHRTLCTLLFFLAWNAPLPAQSTQGTLTGTITDPQGARVPGVDVVALHVDTQQRFTAVSSADGTYVIPALPIGRYEVTASLAGFSTFKQTGIVLEVGQRLRVDIGLKVGQVTETVEVTGEVTRVQTESSAAGTTVEQQRIENLPLNGRHVLDLVKLIPGVQPRNRSVDGFAQVDNQSFSQISFNGGPTYGNQVFLDGGMNTVPVHGELSVVPILDTVEEFRVMTNSLPAEFGQSNGGVINIATRGGTKELHGSLYEFLRNDALDARNAFLTTKDPITGRTKPVVRYNQYGGTVGGPVYIPKIYDGREKTFFYFGYEQWKYRTANISRSTVPTQAERDGDFSNTRDGTGKVIQIYDPATTRPNPNGSGYVRDIFEGNIIPRNRMDPLALKILPYLPLPNVAPNNAFTNADNYLSLESWPIDQSDVSVRIDHNLSEKNKLFARYTDNRNFRANRYWGIGDADTDARTDQRNNYNGLLAHTYIFAPTVVNEFRANLTRQNLDFIHPSFDKGWPAKLGFPEIIPQDAFPPIQIAGMLAIGSARGGFSGGFRKHHTVQFTDSLTFVRGRHTLKMGIDQRWIRLNFTNRSNPSGNFSFAASLTNNPQIPAGTGFGMATFLLGEVSSGSLGIRPQWAFQSWSHGSYLQDDFKVTSRLTLNLGLRYDFSSGPVERWNRSSNFDPFVINPETNTSGALLYAGVTKDRHFTDPPNLNISPRFGFAYSLTGDSRTVVRGGYAVIYSQLESGDTTGDGANSLGFSIDTPFSPPGGGPYRAFLLSEGPSSILQPLGAEGGPSAFRGQSMRFQSMEEPSPYVQQWNLTLQREILGRWVVSAGYAGNRGVHLFGSNYNINQLDPTYFSLGLGLQDQVTNPYFGQIKSGTLSGKTVTRGQLLRPYPDYLDVYTLSSHGGSSIYHAFQMTVERRYASGLSALVSYNLSKMINSGASSNQGSSANPDYRVGRLDQRGERSLDENDIPHRLVVSAVYELPMGPGKPWLQQGVAAALLGGWQLNGIYTYESGGPLVIRGANNFTGINRPNLVGDPNLPDSERSAARWFNTAAFANPPSWTIGNVPRTMPNLRGPAYNNLDMSVFRNIRITEGLKLEFRAEAFNALNTVVLNNPNTSFTPNAAGVNTNPNFGKITTSTNARRLQFGLRLVF
jgi:hypothetical protein